MKYFWDTTKEHNQDLCKFLEVGFDAYLEKNEVEQGQVGLWRCGPYLVSFHRHEVLDHIALNIEGMCGVL